MAGREIGVGRVLADIQSGMDAQGLMRKYGLTQQGVRHLFDQLAAIGVLGNSPTVTEQPGLRRLSVKHLVRDIRAGASFDLLMRRYNLDRDGLSHALTRLVDLNAIDVSSLPKHDPWGFDSYETLDLRSSPRFPVSFEAPIHEALTPENQGRILDITSCGIGMCGLPAKLGERKTLVILGDPTGFVEPFQFEAVCRWVRKPCDSGNWRAGFKIVRIASEAGRELRELIRLVVSADRKMTVDAHDADFSQYHDRKSD